MNHEMKTKSNDAINYGGFSQKDILEWALTNILEQPFLTQKNSWPHRGSEIL
jgi:hypothetical protein